LHDSATGARPVPLPETRTTVAANAAAAQPTSQSTQTASVAPAASKPETKIVEATPSRAEIAASHFAHDVAAPSGNQPPFAVHGSMASQPAAVNAALQQQQQQPQALPQPMPQPVQSTGAGTAVAVSSPAGSNCTTGRYTGEPFGMNFK